MLWLHVEQLLAWLVETLQIKEVVLCLNGLLLDVLDLGLEIGDVAVFYSDRFQEGLDGLQFGVFKLFGYLREVSLPLGPLLYFLQRAKVFLIALIVLVANDFFDLIVPIEQRGFQAIDQILILLAGLYVRQFFIRNVELGEFFLKKNRGKESEVYAVGLFG